MPRYIVPPALGLPGLGTTGQYLRTTGVIALFDDIQARTFAPANPVGTNSAVRVMMGLGATVTLTPVYGGRSIILLWTGNAANNTNADGLFLTSQYGVGAPPANGAALTGTGTAGQVIFDAIPIASKRWPWAKSDLVTGLVAGTAYWFDIALARITGGIATISDVIAVLVEV